MTSVSGPARLSVPSRAAASFSSDSAKSASIAFRWERIALILRERRAVAINNSLENKLGLGTAVSLLMSLTRCPWVAPRYPLSRCHQHSRGNEATHRPLVAIDRWATRGSRDVQSQRSARHYSNAMTRNQRKATMSGNAQRVATDE